MAVLPPPAFCPGVLTGENKMDLWEFVQKYIKTKVDFDGFAGPQCMDLFRQYGQDVWQIPRTESLGADGGAKDLVLRYNEFPIEKKHLALISDKWCGQEGDVAVWGATDKNKYGHVAIVLKALANGRLLVFEQDGFKQDGAKITWRDNKNIIGYLRKWPA